MTNFFEYLEIERRLVIPGYGKPLFVAFILVAYLVGNGNDVGAADGIKNAQSPITLKQAFGLYTNKQYSQSADAFESLLKSQPPSARLYYHAALANFSAHRKARARQLCQHIVTYFGSTQEAAHSKKLFPELKLTTAQAPATQKKTAPADPEVDEKSLPPSFWASLSADLREKLKTPAGKLALKGALADYNKRVAAQKALEDRKTRAKNPKIAVVDQKTEKTEKSDQSAKKEKKKKTKSKPEFTVSGNFAKGARPFTAQRIAKDGANGIDQNINPNCWFEASMAALAELPRGQRLLADMIRFWDEKTYVVRFPGDGVEYKITESDLKARGINDRALWASLIECAQVMKFPGNAGANGESGQESRLAVGLRCITGCKAETISPGSASVQELSSFIGGAVSSKNPIVAGTWPASYISGYPQLVVPQHAYTIIGFDPSSKLVTIRNPHGAHSDLFYHPSDRSHQQFEQLGDGKFKLHLHLFQKYFNQACRSFI